MSIQVNKIEKKIRLSKLDIIRYQITYEYVFLKKEHLNSFDINLLSLLSLYGPIELGKCCSKATKALYDIKEVEDYVNKSQNVRNRLGKLKSRGLIIKTKDNLLQLQEGITIHTKGNILLNYNYLSLEDDKT
jgi:hypothetical protein